MNKTRKLFVAAAALVAAVLLIGCSNAMDGSVSTVNKNSPHAVGTVVTKGVIANFDDFDTLPANNGARTILPELDTRTYDYYIYGKTIDGSEEYPPEKTSPAVAAGTPEKLTITDTAGVKSFSITATAARWEFTVYALKSGATAPATAAAAKTAACLIGYAYSDLSGGNDSVTFTLKSDGLKGPGDVSLRVELSDDHGSTHWNDLLPTGAEVNAYIENFVNGDVVVDKQELKFEDAGGTARDFAEYAASAVAPGTYNFVIRIVDGSEIKGEWSDVLVVLPTRDTVATVYVPRLLPEPPADVAYLTAVYIKDSEDASDHQGYYKVQFEWDNTPTTETHYELQVADISGLGKVIDQSSADKYDWTSAATAANPVYDYTPGGIIPTDENTAALNRTAKQLLAASEYCAGSLNRNNTNIVLYLELGKQYTARVRAINTQGPSENWTHLTLTAGTSGAAITALTKTTGEVTPNADVGGTTAYFLNEKTGNGYPVTAITEIAGYTGSGEKTYPAAEALTATINRFRITYHLNLGQYRKLTGVTSNALTKNDVVEYHSQDAAGDGYPLWNGVGYDDSDASSTDDLHLYLVGDGTKRGFKQWATWDYFAAQDATKIVYERYDSDGTTKKKDNDNYDGYENYDVYAVYAGVTNAMSGTIPVPVDYAKYKLDATWIKWGDDAIETTAGYSVKSFKYSKGVAAENTKLKNATFVITIPAGALPDTPGMYDGMQMVIYNKDTFEVKTIQKLTTIAGAGTGNSFTKVDMSAWKTGMYVIDFVATKSNTPNDIVAKASISLEITD